ncbi:MAG: hypothetical protein ABIE42_09210 [Candidatus Eisenbacteria bacterium]
MRSLGILYGAGLVPGVTYPDSFPTTTETMVLARVAGLPTPQIREAFQKFLDTPGISPADAKAFLKRWGDAAWNSIQSSDKAYRGEWNRFLRAALSTPASVTMTGMEEFFDRWRLQNVEWRKENWDRRIPSRDQLRSYLDTLSQTQPIPRKAVIEVLRQATAYADLAHNIFRISSTDYAATIRDVIRKRLNDNTFGNNLAMGVEEMIKFLGRALAFVAKNILAPVAKGLWASVPWWLWALLVLGGGGYVAVATAPGRAVVRRVRERRVRGGTAGAFLAAPLSSSALAGYTPAGLRGAMMRCVQYSTTPRGVKRCVTMEIGPGEADPEARADAGITKPYRYKTEKAQTRGRPHRAVGIKAYPRVYTGKTGRKVRTGANVRVPPPAAAKQRKAA